MIIFDTNKERYEVSEWNILRNGDKIESDEQLHCGDEIRLNVKFLNCMIDKECVLFIRSYLCGKQNGLLAQEVTIYPDVLPFDLTSDVFVVPDNGADKLEVALYNDFSSVTDEEEILKIYLLPKYTPTPHLF